MLCVLLHCIAACHVPSLALLSKLENLPRCSSISLMEEINTHISAMLKLHDAQLAQNVITYVLVASAPATAHHHNFSGWLWPLFSFHFSPPLCVVVFSHEKMALYVQLTVLSIVTVSSEFHSENDMWEPLHHDLKIFISYWYGTIVVIYHYRSTL